MRLTFRAAPENLAGPGKWLAHAAMVQGSWWPGYSSWLAERSGDEKRRRGRGSKQFVPLGAAQGTYVLDR
jgi:polyhydroxyalkanoate synthase